jgi:serine/threonine protein kinase
LFSGLQSHVRVILYAGVITFILLGGYSPFSDEGSQTKMFEKIKKGEYAFDPDYWGHISKQAKDLIRGMLTVDPTKRLTADQALTHPWVGLTVEELSMINLDANLTEFKKFNANRKFKAAAKAVMAVNKMNRLIGKTSDRSSIDSTTMTPNPAAQRD